MYEPDNEHTILPPEIDEEDVSQEQALMRLEYLADPTKGSHNPRKEFIRQRLKTALGSQGLFGDMPAGATLVSGEKHTSPETIQKILEWAFEKGDVAEELILEFLQNPTPATLKVCIKRLIKAELIPELQPQRKEQEVSLSSVLLRQLKKHRKMSMDELYTLAEREHVSKRPRAAVRQTIRRWQGKGFISVDENQIVYWNPNTHEK